jgi:hypothetical protein
MKRIKLILLAMFISIFSSKGQENKGKISITSSVGLLIPKSDFAKSYSTSLAFNSGIEYLFKKNFYLQGVIDFNTVKYSQQVRETNSNFLFQNTNSSVLLLGFNMGNNIALIPSKQVLVAPYIGAGYINVGEPRLTIDNQNGIITQNVRRMQGIYTKAGLRLLVDTHSKFLQIIYLDFSGWKSPIKVQESNPQAWSLLGGTKIPF